MYQQNKSYVIEENRTFYFVRTPVSHNFDPSFNRQVKLMNLLNLLDLLWLAQRNLLLHLLQFLLFFIVIYSKYERNKTTDSIYSAHYVRETILYTSKLKGTYVVRILKKKPIFLLLKVFSKNVRQFVLLFMEINNIEWSL